MQHQQDAELAAFHNQASAGFGQQQILDAERALTPQVAVASLLAIRLP